MTTCKIVLTARRWPSVDMTKRLVGANLYRHVVNHTTWCEYPQAATWCKYPQAFFHGIEIRNNLGVQLNDLMHFGHKSLRKQEKEKNSKKRKIMYLQYSRSLRHSAETLAGCKRKPFFIINNI